MAAPALLDLPEDTQEQQLHPLQPDAKITDLIADWRKTNNNNPFVSFEYFPPRTDVGLAHLQDRLARMAKQVPLFMDVTWGAGGSTSHLTTELCLRIKRELGIVPNMHLTCTNMDESKIEYALSFAIQHGIRNIVALRGDPPAGQEWKQTAGGFACARDLVQHIHEQHPDTFCITVAAYPQGHPDRIKLVTDRDLTPSELLRATKTPEGYMVCSDEEYAIELQYLKSKVDAGAHLITTQMFFDAMMFVQFVKDCEAVGITVPIIPGLMLLQNYGGFKRMIAMCKSQVPQDLLDKIEAVKDDEEKIKDVGIQFGYDLCVELTHLLGDKMWGYHFYTLNLEHVTYGIMQKLGVFKQGTTVTP